MSKMWILAVIILFLLCGCASKQIVSTETNLLGNFIISTYTDGTESVRAMTPQERYEDYKERKRLSRKREAELKVYIIGGLTDIFEGDPK